MTNTELVQKPDYYTLKITTLILYFLLWAWLCQIERISSLKGIDISTGG